MEPFKIIEPAGSNVPILISVPHCGFEFPDEIKNEYNQQLIKAPDDTDWFVDRLYGFASEMGITMIKSVYSRWVIDLNRDPESKPLYTDGRIITELVPKTTFTGEPLYQSEVPGEDEIERRVEKYYKPYHKEIENQLTSLKSQFGKVLLWEAHSIRQLVPTIHAHKFPDLILGDADGTSASSNLTSTTLTNLRNSTYQLSHNAPFKGGFITRQFGDPDNDIHALQLEMTKVNYMDDAELEYDNAKAGEMQKVLIPTFEALIRVLI